MVTDPLIEELTQEAVRTEPNYEECIKRLKNPHTVRLLHAAMGLVTESAEFLADCTESFENVEYGELTGEALAKAIYSDITIGFIADQTAKFLGDWANFTVSSTKS